MKWLRKIFDFYLDASVHVAIAVVSLVGCTAIILRVNPDLHLVYFLFFGTICCYNFIKYGVEARKYILVTNTYHRYIQFFSFTAAGIAAYHAFFLSTEAWLVLSALGFLIGLYALPVLPQARNLRKLGILKIMMVGFVWGGSTVILPVISSGSDLPWDVHVEAFQRLLMVLVLMLPFEIRDLEYDQPSLGTIPQRIGVKATRLTGILAATVFFLATYLKDHLLIAEIVGKGLLSLMLLVILLITRQRQSRYFASFWVESVPLIWLGILVVLYGAG